MAPPVYIRTRQARIGLHKKTIDIFHSLVSEDLYHLISFAASVTQECHYQTVYILDSHSGFMAHINQVANADEHCFGQSFRTGRIRIVKGLKERIKSCVIQNKVFESLFKQVLLSLKMIGYTAEGRMSKLCNIPYRCCRIAFPGKDRAGCVQQVGTRPFSVLIFFAFGFQIIIFLKNVYIRGRNNQQIKNFSNSDVCRSNIRYKHAKRCAIPAEQICQKQAITVLCYAYR